MMPPEAAPPPLNPAPRRTDAARLAAVWLLVVATAVVGLRVADALPRTALGVSRGVTRAADVAELERATGRRMPVPAYFPDTIAWPPAEARRHSSGAAAIWCRRRDGVGLALMLATAPHGASQLLDAVLPPSVELQRERAARGDRVVIVSRVRQADGSVWHQVQWASAAQIILIRYRGTLDELLMIAGSVND
jgi:hypothetical protein